ncbi:MAG: zinc-binding dehydrogenase [Fusobacteriaceae bacterium]|jgi:threonine dehydrogenase-like Zn-dependent dehydrogenase|nr:zinc-binding dehydrogenase [Fusobacteriaceae bacterium]
MKTRAVRLYGEMDLRLEEFLLPEIKDDEILVEVVSDSVCMSSYKAALQGKKHKRVPDNIDTHPIIIGHEFAGNIVQVGKLHQNKFKKGTKFAQQPALNYKGSMESPGYSYEYFGGACTYCIIPPEVMELNCLINYSGKSYYEASLAEPMSCIIGGYHAMYHTKMGVYEHQMGIVEGGKLAIIAGAGPMGLGAVDYALHADRKPSLLVVTDIDDARLERASKIFTKEEGKKNGVEIIFVNTNKYEDKVAYLRQLTGDSGFDDVFVLAPVKDAVETGDKILGRDGCLNFFAGPSDTKFSAEINQYNVHYGYTHLMGTTGGNTNDLLESLQLTEKGLINPAVMVTHVGGIDSVAETTLKLPKIPGGKKLSYTQINMPLTAIDDFRTKGKDDKRFDYLADICEKNNGLWSLEAEEYLLENFK